MPDCAYCDCDVTAHDPVVVSEGIDAGDAGQPFCNYGCLAAYIDAENLTTGAVCHVDL